MYKLNKTTSITRLADGASIPNDPANNDYADYLKWVAAGNTPTPVDVPTLAQAKATKITSLEASRKQAVDTMPPVTVAAKQYPATTEYRELVSGMARRQAAAKPIPATLRGSDGVAVTLTPVLLGQIDDAIAATVQAQWDKYWTKFDQVQAATTNAAVDAVVW